MKKKNSAFSYFSNTNLKSIVRKIKLIVLQSVFHPILPINMSKHFNSTPNKKDKVIQGVSYKIIQYKILNREQAKHKMCELGGAIIHI